VQVPSASRETEVRVTKVVPDGAAAAAGVVAGDDLLTLGEHRVVDSIDLAFALGWTEEEVAEYRFGRGGEEYGVRLPVAEPGEIGLELEEDGPKTCGNRCVFCFVDQLPRGLRQSLYIKDEDYRLSFTHGNYVTLTNISDSDYDRIARQRLSPLYVSVHATDDGVRRALLGNPRAPSILGALRRLAQSRIAVHAQIVICPGINDGAALEATLKDLFDLGGTIESVAVVPVGLTEHRTGLAAVRPVGRPEAEEIVRSVEDWQRRFAKAGRGRTVFAADELYLIAGRELPPLEHYEDFPQLENGVGLLRSFEADLARRAGELDGVVSDPLTVTVLTGKLAAGFLREAMGEALGKLEGLEWHVVAVENTLMGRSVTVAGLLSGRDLARGLRGAPDSDLFLVPLCALNSDGFTVDGMTVDEVASSAGRSGVVAADDIVSAVLDHLRRGRSGRDDGAST
jgi:putative radical SAM enzyme (TIGR03279 family)